MIYEPRGHRVAPLSTLDIRRKAEYLRHRYKLGSAPLDVGIFLEDILLFEDIHFHVVPDEDLPYQEAVADTADRIITIRESVYEGALAGHPHYRFTIPHEAGHIELGHRSTFSRSLTRTWPPYEDSETQADRFAAELLMPVAGVRQCKHPRELAEMYGVSQEAAEIRFFSLAKEGLL